MERDEPISFADLPLPPSYRPTDCYIDDTTVTLNWGGYEYWIGLSRINTPEKLLHWVCHLSQKRWMDKQKLVYLITLVSRHFQWDDQYP